MLIIKKPCLLLVHVSDLGKNETKHAPVLLISPWVRVSV